MYGVTAGRIRQVVMRTGIRPARVDAGRHYWTRSQLADLFPRPIRPDFRYGHKSSESGS